MTEYGLLASFWKKNRFALVPIAERNGFGREDEEREEKKEKGGAGSGAAESEISGALW